MKYRKGLISLITAVSLAGGTVAFAADYTADTRGVVNFNEVFDVSGLIGEYDKYLTYRVVDSENKLHNFGQIELDPEGDGNVSFGFRIKGETGDYKLVLSNVALGEKIYTIDYVNNVFTEFNDIKIQNDTALMDDFILANGRLFSFNTDAYALLTEAERTKMAQAFIDANDAETMEELASIADGMDVVNVLFETSETEDALITFISGDIVKEESLFNKDIGKVFTDGLSSDTARRTVVNKIMGKPFDAKLVDIFEVEVLKSYVGQIKYYQDMDEVILCEKNIWGFYDSDLKSYEKCDKASVKKEMRTAVNSVDSIEEYREKFSEIIKANPKKSDSGSGNNGGGGGGSSFVKPSSISESYNVKGNDLPSNVADIEYDLPKTERKITFSDLNGYDWAYEAIVALTDNYIINGVSENKFQPSRTIKREEFVKLITAGLRLTGAEATTTFKDVNKNDWYYAVVAAAERAQLVNGDENGNFGVGKEITRQDAAVLLSRTAAYKGVALEQSVEIEFTDDALIAGYAKTAVKELSQAGIINGMEDGSFVPEAALTRAEAAKMIYGLFKALSII